MYAKEHVSDTKEKRLCVLKRGISWPAPLPEFPDPLPAAGFSEERLKYLRKQVRPFVRECHRQEFCP